MRRRLLNLLTALSLVLCAAVAGVVASSFWREHRFDWGRRAYVGNRVSDVRWAVTLGWGEVQVRRSGSTLTYFSEDWLNRQLASRFPAASYFNHVSNPASAPRPRDGTVWHRLGFAWSRVAGANPNNAPNGPTPLLASGFDEFAAAAPVWPALLLALPPGFWLIRQVRRFRARRNDRQQLCLSCGYDLRATPDKCPECGAETR